MKKELKTWHKNIDKMLFYIIFCCVVLVIIGLIKGEDLFKLLYSLSSLGILLIAFMVLPYYIYNQLKQQNKGK